jgi:nucleotide-binding universal stress UspA family protein
MSAMRSIAVAVDGSPASDGALAEAVKRAAQEGRPLVGVFVIDTGWADFIGNDWQSAAGARQGFLDYIRAQLESQAEAARAQFTAAAHALPASRFEVIAGEPHDALADFLDRGEAQCLFIGRETFQVCGRPSARRLATDIARRHPAVRLV